MSETTEKKKSPILFTAPMVRAILEGRKSQTRRLVRWPAALAANGGPAEEQLDNLGDCVTLVVSDAAGKQHDVSCPYGGEGDVLWVREAFRLPSHMNDLSPVEVLEKYGAVDVLRVVDYLADDKKPENYGRYRSPRFMPQGLSRLGLNVVAHPDVERLSKVTDEDAVAEGIKEISAGSWGLPEWPLADLQPTARAAYLKLFAGINEDVAGDPWVWKTTFARA